MSYQQQLNEAAKRCHVGSYAVGANRICAEADATIAAKDAEIARLREALSVIAYPLNIGKVYHMDAVTQARAALAQVAEVGK